jgi:hypothetical protein
MVFIVEIKFINCLAGLMDWAVRWKSRYFNVIDLAGGLLVANQHSGLDPPNV